MLIAQAIEDDGILFFEHDPKSPPAGWRKDGEPVMRETVDV